MLAYTGTQRYIVEVINLKLFIQCANERNHITQKSRSIHHPTKNVNALNVELFTFITPATSRAHRSPEQAETE